MATSQQQLVCDNSTLANFKAWAQPISTFFATAGWTQASDTGQVNWSTISSVPGSAAYVYEVWKPGDALTTFYVKIEYGNNSGTNSPSIRLTISSATNGAGTATGFIIGPYNTNQSGITPASTTTQYECNFSGSNNRIGVMMWRNAPGASALQQLFAIERSLDSSGAPTGSYVTLFTGGWVNTWVSCFNQRSLVFGVGPTPSSSSSNNTSYGSGLAVRAIGSYQVASGTSAFNNSIPFDLAAPMVGYFDYPCTVIGAAFGADMVDGVTFQTTVYGATRTYMPGKQASFSYAGPENASNVFAVCMRYD